MHSFKASEQVTAGSADLPTRRPAVVFGVISIALIMASMDLTIVATALPALQGALHTSVSWSAWTITGYALGQIIAMPISGVISDQYGRKRVFLITICVFAIASLCCGGAQTIVVLIIFRFLQSLGGGAFMPCATGIISDAFPASRERAIGMFTTVFTVGAMLGPVLGGVCIAVWSWRAIFFINVPISIVLLILGRKFIPNSAAKTPSARLDLVGVTLLTIGILGGSLAITELGVSAKSSPTPLFYGSLVIGVIALLAFVRHTVRAVSPLVSPRFLFSPTFAVMNWLNFLLGSVALGVSSLFPLYARDRYSLSLLGAGTLLTARALGAALVATLTTFALRRVGYRLPMTVGYVMISCGLVLLAIRQSSLGPYAWLALSAAVVGIGLGIALPATNNAVLFLAAQHTASVAGLRGMFRQLGGIAGVSATSVVIARSDDPGTAQAYVFVAIAVLMVLCLPLIRFVPARSPAPAAPSPPSYAPE